MRVCVSNLTIIGSDNGLLPNRYQAIIWTCDGIFLIGPIGITWSSMKFYQNSCIFIQEIPVENLVWKMAAILPQPLMGSMTENVFIFHE